jgi:hypothetical protein
MIAKPERRWYTLWWTLLGRHCWSCFAYIQLDKAGRETRKKIVHTVVGSTLMAMLGPLCIIQNDKTTLQFRYLLRNDAEYDFGRESNTIDWPAHTCAEFETAPKLRVVRN